MIALLHWGGALIFLACPTLSQDAKAYQGQWLWVPVLSVGLGTKGK